MQFIPHIKLNDDMFIVEIDSTKRLLYAPLRRRAVEITTDQVSDIQNETELGKKILAENGFSASTWAFPRPPADNYYSPMIPGSIMLSVTSRCNLRCAYCFADGGDYDDTMPWHIVQAFLDFVPGAARRNGNKYSVSFHGDGETLMAPDVTFKTCAALRELAGKHSFKLNISMTTNATLINKNNLIILVCLLTVMRLPREVIDLSQVANLLLAQFYAL